MKRIRRALVLSLPGLVVCGLGAWVAWPRAAEVSHVVVDVDRDDDEPLLDPLSATHGLAGLTAPAPRTSAPALPAARAPEDLAREVGARVTLVPYEGALASPVQVLETGVANALDRARALAALLRAAGHEARVVHAPSAARSSTTTPEHAVFAPGAPALRADLEARVRALAPRAWAVVAGERAWLERAAAAPPPGRTAWAQVRRDGAWVDLPVPGEVVDPAARATPLDEAALAWTVTLRLSNVWQGAARPQEVLAHTARAEALHAAGVAVTNLPDRSPTRFVPTLRVAGRTVQGTPFDLRGRTLTRQLLHVEVRGPGTLRRATRVLLEPRATGDLERALEVAALARVVVTTGPVSDEVHADALARTLAHGAALLRGEDEGWLDAPPLRALALLGASRALAGRVGDAARAGLAFQARPAVAIEREWVAVDAGGIDADAVARRHGLDLVDPGHAFRGPEAARAAVEQGVLGRRVRGEPDAATGLASASGDPSRRSDSRWPSAAYRAGAPRVPCRADPPDRRQPAARRPSALQPQVQRRHQGGDHRRRRRLGP